MHRTVTSILAAVIVVLVAPLACSAEVSTPFSDPIYNEKSSTSGVVIISVNWMRKWKCGQSENAQLKSFSFDKTGIPKENDEAKADLVLEDTSILPASSRFINYAYIVEPGTYQLSTYNVKVAQSITEVGYYKATRSNLIQDGKSKAGSFTVAAGEIVYIGHFFLDCAQDPIPWRYYPRDREGFNQYISVIKKEFSAIDTDKVKFRLFDTTSMGNPFTLP